MGGEGGPRYRRWRLPWNGRAALRCLRVNTTSRRRGRAGPAPRYSSAIADETAGPDRDGAALERSRHDRTHKSVPTAKALPFALQLIVCARRFIAGLSPLAAISHWSNSAMSGDSPAIKLLL
jgi:hypothetical protein